MELMTIAKLVLVLAVVLIVLAIGLRARVADPLLLVRDPWLGARAMLSMFVAFPLFVLWINWLLPLGQPVGAALLALAVSPTPPLLPKKGRRMLASGIADTEYVEILSVIAHVTAIDTFARGLGIPVQPLPAPLRGAPSRYRPAEARQNEACRRTSPGTSMARTRRTISSAHPPISAAP